MNKTEFKKLLDENKISYTKVGGVNNSFDVYVDNINFIDNNLILSYLKSILILGNRVILTFELNGGQK